MLPSKLFFDDIFSDIDGFTKNDKLLKCDVYECDGNYNIELDVPGYKKDEIKLELASGYLTISCEKKSFDEENNKKYIRRERVYSKNQRQFYVGDIDESLVKAEFNDGILKVVVPMESKENRTKYISID